MWDLAFETHKKTRHVYDVFTSSKSELSQQTSRFEQQRCVDPATPTWEHRGGLAQQLLDLAMNNSNDAPFTDDIPNKTSIYRIFHCHVWSMEGIWCVWLVLVSTAISVGAQVWQIPIGMHLFQWWAGDSGQADQEHIFWWRHAKSIFAG